MRSTSILFKNTIWLFIYHFASLIVSLTLIPHLTRSLGLVEYGLLAFGLSFIALAGILIDFGFDLYCPYEVAKIRDNTVVLRRFVGAVYVCKATLFSLVIVGTLLFALISKDYSDSKPFIVSLLLPIFGAAIAPTWLFMSLEKFNTIAAPLIVGRIVYLLTTLLIVDSPDDVELVVLLLGWSQIISALFAINEMRKLECLPSTPLGSDVMDVFKGALAYFLSRAAIAGYTAGGGFVLGLFSTRSEVALYFAAEQIYKGLQGLVSPIAQSLYPYMTRMKNVRLHLLVTVFSVVICLSVSVLFYLTGGYAIVAFFGESFRNSQQVLNIFLIALCISVPSILLGYPLLGAFGYGSFVNTSVVFAGILQGGVTVLICYVGLASAVTIASSVVVAESILLSLRLWKAIKIVNVS